MSTINVDDIYPSVDRLLGRTPEDAELKSFLVAIGSFPLPPFGPDELHVYFNDKDLGFSLDFADPSIVKQPTHEDAEGTQNATNAGMATAIFVSAFFYAEGIDGYHAFTGKLPFGIVWSDDPTSVVAKVGQPKFEIKNKKTGLLSAHRWQVGKWMMSASYKGGAKLGHIYLGLT